MFEYFLISDFWIIMGLVLCVLELANGSLVFFLPTGLSSFSMGAILKLQENSVTPEIFNDWYYIIIVWLIMSLLFALLLRKYFRRESTEDDINKYQLLIYWFIYKKSGSPNWARTSDPLINSQLLYQLSYRGTNLELYTTIKK